MDVAHHQGGGAGSAAARGVDVPLLLVLVLHEDVADERELQRECRTLKSAEKRAAGSESCAANLAEATPCRGTSADEEQEPEPADDHRQPAVDVGVDLDPVRGRRDEDAQDTDCGETDERLCGDHEGLAVEGLFEGGEGGEASGTEAGGRRPDSDLGQR